jgi:hypothetical protein
MSRKKILLAMILAVVAAIIITIFPIKGIMTLSLDEEKMCMQSGNSVFVGLLYPTGRKDEGNLFGTACVYPQGQAVYLFLSNVDGKSIQVQSHQFFGYTK